jgi:hypothetical protein
MHVTTCPTLGKCWLHSRTASGVHAARSALVPSAKLSVEPRASSGTKSAAVLTIVKPGRAALFASLITSLESLLATM